jgi:hypothetical protein
VCGQTTFEELAQRLSSKGVLAALASFGVFIARNCRDLLGACTVLLVGLLPIRCYSCGVPGYAHAACQVPDYLAVSKCLSILVYLMVALIGVQFYRGSCSTVGVQVVAVQCTISHRELQAMRKQANCNCLFLCANAGDEAAMRTLRNFNASLLLQVCRS